AGGAVSAGPGGPDRDRSATSAAKRRPRPAGRRRGDAGGAAPADERPRGPGGDLSPRARRRIGRPSAAQGGATRRGGGGGPAGVAGGSLVAAADAGGGARGGAARCRAGAGD